MRLPTSAFALLLFASADFLPAATPLEIWPAVSAAPQGEGIDASGLPQELEPAVRFQKVFLKIVPGSKSAAWRPEMEPFCNPPVESPLGAGLCELARVWIARTQMEEIGALLDGYYRHNVRYPPSLAELGPLPASLQKDPWGGAWTYALAAPQGFSKLGTQRYQLGPARYPQLSTLSEAVRDRPQPHVWAITPREVGGSTALEFHGARSTAVLQPGGDIDGCRLLFIGDKWALMAGTDRLFAIAF